jgi:hypothetical protein
MHRRRSLQVSFDDEGYVVIKVRLEPEDGAVVLRAIEEASADVSETEGDSAESLPEEDDPFDHEAHPSAAARRRCVAPHRGDVSRGRDA